MQITRFERTTRIQWMTRLGQKHMNLTLNSNNSDGCKLWPIRWTTIHGLLVTTKPIGTFLIDACHLIQHTHIVCCNICAKNWTYRYFYNRVMSIVQSWDVRRPTSTKPSRNLMKWDMHHNHPTKMYQVQLVLFFAAERAKLAKLQYYQKDPFNSLGVCPVQRFLLYLSKFDEPWNL